MNRRLLTLVSAILLSSCQVSSQGEESHNLGVETFSGGLSKLNGQGVWNSGLGIRLFAESDTEEPVRYIITSGCTDSGFLDQADGRFWSGTAPAKNGEMVEFMKKRRLDAHCPPEDHDRYMRLMQLMHEGAELQMTGEHGSTASFQTPSGASAEFQMSSVVRLD